MQKALLKEQIIYSTFTIYSFSAPWISPHIYFTAAVDVTEVRTNEDLHFVMTEQHLTVD